VAQECKACISPNRSQIDAALAAGESTRGAAGRFGVSKSSIARHRSHIGDDLARAADARGLRAGDSLAQQLRDLVADAQKIQADAEAQKDLRAGLMAVRELTRLVELGAKLSGALTTRHSVTVTVQQTPSRGEALAWSMEALLVLASADQQRAFAAELLQAADQDQLFIEDKALGATPNAPLQLINGK
jgi:hypothetical protein